MRSIRRWLSDPRVLVDVLVVVIVGVLTVVDVASASAEVRLGERPADALAYGLAVAGSLSLFWRRRFPITVLAVVTALVAAFWIRGYSAFMSVLGLTALFAVAVHADRRRAAWSAVVASWGALLIVAAFTLLDRPAGFAYFTALSMGAFLVGATIGGVIVRNRGRIFADTERRAAAAEADRLAEARRAVVRERARIAREMHDVVAHGMSVVAVQAAAGREIVHADPDKAAEVFARIETVGRESLAELRRMLGVLRDTAGVDASLVPQPGLDDIASVVAQASATGVATELTVDGTPRTVEAGVALAAYRIVQEALTNVRKHAGPSASAAVHVTYRPGALVVEVVDDGCGAAAALAATGAGKGLIGMRERVEIYGGEFTAGPRPGGGYAVHAILPLGATSDRPSVVSAAEADP